MNRVSRLVNRESKILSHQQLQKTVTNTGKVEAIKPALKSSVKPANLVKDDRRQTVQFIQERMKA
jgi:hypothetical protein